MIRWDEIEERLRKALAATGQGSSDFDLNPEVQLPAERRLRQAAVMVVLDRSGPTPQVVLTKRSSELKHHPGQIAFPGGKKDDSDPSLEAAALREVREEIGLPSERIDLLGSLAAHETVTGFSVTPFIGLIDHAFTPTPEPGEVAEVFRVPLAHVLDPTRFRVEDRNWHGITRRYYAVPYGPYYIWGATARILRSLAERMA